MASASLCCSICAEVYKNADEILATKCGHVFHNLCFQDWRTRSTTCPECRAADQTTQRIFLHIEDPTEIERKFTEEKIKLINQVSVLETQQHENEQHFYDIQQALSASEEQVYELQQKLELTNALSASYEQELAKIKQALEESEMNFMCTLEQLKKSENLAQSFGREIDFLKLQNARREEKIANLRAENAENDKQSQEIHVMLQNKLQISQNEILQLNRDINELKIKNEQQNNINSNVLENEQLKHEETIQALELKLKQSQTKLLMLKDQLKDSQAEISQLNCKMNELNIKNQASNNALENGQTESVEEVKRLELKLKQLSLALDKEIKLSTNLTVENMKLKSIITLKMPENEENQKIGTDCDETLHTQSVEHTSKICQDLIDLAL